MSPDFKTIAEARAWQREQQDTLEAARGVARNDGELGAVIDDFVTAAENGLARDRGGVEFSPQRLRELREALNPVDAQLGSMRIEDVRRRHVQALVDQLHASGMDVDRIKAVVEALRALYIYAIQREAVDFSPVVQLSLPGGNGNGAAPAPTPSYTPTPPPVTQPLGAPTQPLSAPTQPLGAPTQPLGAPTQPLGAPTQPLTAATLAPPLDGQPTASMPTGMMSANGTNPTFSQQTNDALMPERVLWWTVLIIVVVSVLIAIVLAAESV